MRRRQVESVNARLVQLLDFLQRTAPGGAAEDKSSDRIMVKSSGEIFFLKVSEIDWIEAEGTT